MPENSTMTSPEAVTFQENVKPPPPPCIASSPRTTLKSPDTRRMNGKSDARTPTIHTKKVIRFCQFLSPNSKEYMWEWIPRFPVRKEFTDRDARPEIPDSVLSQTVGSVPHSMPS